MEFKVFVQCMTYNHSRFIVDALNGFSMQNTTFPYVCCIMDDFSNDGEQDTIKQYLSENFIEDENSIFSVDEDSVTIFKRHKSNYNCYFLVVLLKYNHYQLKKSKFEYYREWWHKSQYIALCEGDDYWTDKEKLQIQVDLLDKHDECSFCYHASEIVYDDSYTNAHKAKERYEHVKTSYSFDEIVVKDHIPTASLIYRKEIVGTDLYKKIAEKKFMIIKMLLICALNYGKSIGVDKPMCVYRKHGGGMSLTLDIGATALKKINTYIYIADLFSKSQKRSIHRYLKHRIWDAYILTPLSDSQLWNMIRTEYVKSPVIGLQLSYMFIKHKAKNLVRHYDDKN